eukprot:TRINITY_DN111235_c0_g1_i1.p1 TRINITY_DN111235_c0_g1~~TRINITY_DN111235_c0_g1_i1.p1  ORF type:complete len:609 (+),score=103.86 TRINITY_DN111235_c0_g1_i1:81-1907(+)
MQNHSYLPPESQTQTALLEGGRQWPHSLQLSHSNSVTIDLWGGTTSPPTPACGSRSHPRDGVIHLAPPRPGHYVKPQGPTPLACSYPHSGHHAEPQGSQASISSFRDKLPLGPACAVGPTASLMTRCLSAVPKAHSIHQCVLRPSQSGLSSFVPSSRSRSPSPPPPAFETLNPIPCQGQQPGWIASGHHPQNLPPVIRERSSSPPMAPAAFPPQGRVVAVRLLPPARSQSPRLQSSSGFHQQDSPAAVDVRLPVQSSGTVDLRPQSVSSFHGTRIDSASLPSPLPSHASSSSLVFPRPVPVATSSPAVKIAQTRDVEVQATPPSRRTSAPGSPRSPPGSQRLVASSRDARAQSSNQHFDALSGTETPEEGQTLHASSPQALDDGQCHEMFLGPEGIPPPEGIPSEEEPEKEQNEDLEKDQLLETKKDLWSAEDDLEDLPKPDGLPHDDIDFQLRKWHPINLLTEEAEGGRPPPEEDVLALEDLLMRKELAGLLLAPLTSSLEQLKKTVEASSPSPREKRRSDASLSTTIPVSPMEGILHDYLASTSASDSLQESEEDLLLEKALERLDGELSTLEAILTKVESSEPDPTLVADQVRWESATGVWRRTT